MSPDGPMQKFGEYHLVERIAVGGMAEVWLARAYGLAGFEKSLVIKRILDDLAKNDEFVKLFIYEARIAVLLQHANIVQVFDLGQADGTLYMAMEYVEGVDLGHLARKVRKRGPFPLPIALFILSEVLKALRFAHERVGEDGTAANIVHCDVSPHNVLISNAGEVKITDFGISRAAFQASFLKEKVRGKYAYMSPEQIDNHDLDGRSDLFSLGILMWELLTGRRLFKARTREETLTRVRRAEAPSPRLYRPQISEELEGIILRALERRPEQRYQSAAEMLDALGTLMIREGHRVTNHDLAAFLQELDGEPGGAQRSAAAEEVVQEQKLLVLACEAIPLNSGVMGQSEGVVSGWADALVECGAQVWERNSNGLLAVFPLDSGLQEGSQSVLAQLQALQKMSETAGFSLAAGVVPGEAHIYRDTSRPSAGWELTGPFYLARWMMNVSAQHGKIMLTGTVANSSESNEFQLFGQVAVEKDRYIHLYHG